jgi:polyribonucleotide nucleotidyltransferase
MNVHKVSAMIGERELSIEIGKLAKQAHGSAVVRYGDTVVLVTAVAADKPREGIDFFPLTVDYRENFYAAGKIPVDSSNAKASPRNAKFSTAA